MHHATPGAFNVVLLPVLPQLVFEVALFSLDSILSSPHFSCLIIAGSTFDPSICYLVSYVIPLVLLYFSFVLIIFILLYFSWFVGLLYSCTIFYMSCIEVLILYRIILSFLFKYNRLVYRNINLTIWDRTTLFCTIAVSDESYNLGIYSQWESN